MNESSQRESERPTIWCKMGEVPLHQQDGCEKQAAAEIAQALGQLQLPSSLLQKLQTSVYNAINRIAARLSGGELLLVLFIAGPVLVPAASDETTKPVMMKQTGAPDVGWGYFLIERRGLAHNGAGPPPYIVELYCYQEGQ
jgi:hypothetical protein